jgi:hypothetical protein
MASFWKLRMTLRRKKSFGNDFPRIREGRAGALLALIHRTLGGEEDESFHGIGHSDGDDERVGIYVGGDR